MNKLNFEKSRVFLLSSIPIAIILISIGGYYIYSISKERVKNQQYRELKTIAELKVSQIVQWNKERYSETIFFSQNEDISSKIVALVKGDSSVKQSLTKSFSHISSNNRYENIYILNNQGKLIFTLDINLTQIDSIDLKKSKESILSNQIIIGDFYYNHFHSEVHLNYFAPVNENGKPRACLVFSTNPKDYLYPLIQDWPTPSKTAETLIIRKEGDSVLFLNKPKHIISDPLKYKVSLTSKNAPSVAAIKGIEGIFEGTDYRGVKVISMIKPIPNTNWYLLAKVDKDEMYAELYVRIVFIVIIVTVIIAFVVIMMVWIYHLRQRNIYRELYTNKSELHHSQELFKATLYSIGDGVITADIKGLVTQMNPVAEQLTGWFETDARGKKLEQIFNIICEDNGQIIKNPASTILKEGEVFNLANNTLLISKSGKEVPIANSGAPIKNIKGEIVGVVIVFRDQTVEREHQRALEESKERFAHLFERAPLGYQSLDENGFFLEVNEAWLNTLGYSKNEVIGKCFEDFLPNESVDRFKKTFSDFKQSGLVHNEFVMAHKNGSLRHIAFDGRIGHKNDGSFEKTHCILKDVTEEKKLLNKLKESEEKYRSLIAQMQLGLVVHKMLYDEKGNPSDCKFLDVNPSFEKLLGVTRDKLIGRTLLEDNPLFEKELIEKFNQVVITGEPFSTERYDRKYMRYHKILVYKYRENEFAAIIQDITESKEIEAKLKENQEIFKYFMQNSPIYVFFKDKDIKPILLSNNYEQMLGMPLPKIIGKTMDELFPSKLAKDMIALDKKILSEGKPTIIDEEFNEHYYTTIKFPILIDGEPKFLAGYTIDITERKKAEIELLRLKNNLEQAVYEKTSELQEKLTELERFRDATIDRELRMKELRDEIKRLKGDE